MMEKQGVINEENTPVTPEIKKCCGGSCHPSPAQLAEHMQKRACEAAQRALACTEVPEQDAPAQS